MTPVQMGPVDAAAVQRFADTIMELIRSDMADGVHPVSVKDFTELHDRCDANMYYEDAGQVYDGSLESIAEINAISDLIDKRIFAGELVAEQVAAADAAYQIGDPVTALYATAGRREAVIAAIAQLAA